MRQDLLRLNRSVWLLIFAVITFSSCDSNRVFEENRHLESTEWNRNDIQKFSVPIEDISALHNVYINVRHNGQYANSNLYLFVTIQSPDSNSIRDTVECVLADEKGEWLGSGLGDLYNNHLLFKKDVIFPKKGTYTFSLEQAMRVAKLENIEDIGIRVEKAE